jgi:hypothetical protein
MPVQRHQQSDVRRLFAAFLPGNQTVRCVDSASAVLRAVLVCSVLWWSSSGCTSSADGPVEVASAAEIACEDSQPQLAPHLHP